MRPSRPASSPSPAATTSSPGRTGKAPASTRSSPRPSRPIATSSDDGGRLHGGRPGPARRAAHGAQPVDGPARAVHQCRQIRRARAPPTGRFTSPGRRSRPLRARASSCAGRSAAARRSSPPSRKGFGSRLIQEGLARELNGEVRLIYEPDRASSARRRASFLSRSGARFHKAHRSLVDSGLSLLANATRFSVNSAQVTKVTIQRGRN